MLGDRKERLEPGASQRESLLSMETRCQLIRTLCQRDQRADDGAEQDYTLARTAELCTPFI